MLHIKDAGLLFITWQSQNTNWRKQQLMPAIREKSERVHLTVCGTVHCISYDISLFNTFQIEAYVFFDRKDIIVGR